MGTIIITVTGDPEEAGSQRIVTFEDYFVNGNQLEGTRTFTNDGINENGNPSFNVTLVDGRITTEGGEVFTREANKTREQVEGADTDTREDDAYQH